MQRLSLYSVKCHSNSRTEKCNRLTSSVISVRIIEYVVLSTGSPLNVPVKIVTKSIILLILFWLRVLNRCKVVLFAGYSILNSEVNDWWSMLLKTLMNFVVRLNVLHQFVYDFKFNFSIWRHKTDVLRYVFSSSVVVRDISVNVCFKSKISLSKNFRMFALQTLSSFYIHPTEK